jgi:hypothetical protein
MKSENGKVILVEPYFELNTPNVIARETGGEVVIMPSSVEGAKGSLATSGSWIMTWRT